MTNAVAIAQQGSNNTTFRNRIINGACVIDQRNAGASVTIVGGPNTLDRWKNYSSPSSKYSVQQNAGSVTPPVGFTNYLGCTSLSAYSVTSTDYFFTMQRIEGYNVADLNWGSANAKTVTLSFWVYSSLTGTFGGAMQNDNADRSYPFSYTISSANTWEYKTVTVPGPTSGTWLTTNGSGIQLTLGLGVGSTYSGTAGAWANSNYFSATGAVSVVGTNGATFYITGVQLEAGSAASPFENRLYGTELQLCQRYFNIAEGFVGGATSTTFGCSYTFPVIMRTSPSVAPFGGVIQITQVGVNDYTQSSANVSIPASGVRVDNRAVSLSFPNFSGLSSNICYSQNVNAGGTAQNGVALSAEL